MARSGLLDAFRSSGFGGTDLSAFGGGGRGGGGRGRTGAERLASAQRRAAETGDSGLLGFAKDIADRVGLDSAGNAVMRGLEIADYGRSAVTAALMEGTDALAAATGGESTARDTDRVRQTGASFSDFWENTKNRVGFGDYIEADERIGEDTPIWLKRAMGLVGDVGFDPLTYLTFGASAVAKGGVAGARASRGGRVALSTDDVAESLIRGGDAASAERVLSSRSAAAAPREALEAAGVDAGAMFAGRWRVRPLDGVYGTMSRATGRVRRVAADQIANRVKPETWAKFERVPGVHAIRTNPRLKQQGVANVKALEWALGWRDAGTSARNLRREYGDRLNELARQFGDTDRGAITRALEADDAVVPGSNEFRSFFDDIANDVEEVTGAKVPRLKNYVSHVLTDEAKAALRKAGQASPAGGRANPFLQHRGRKGTIEEINTQFMEDAYDASRNKFGSRVDKLFKDDPFEIAKSYLDQVERFVRTRAFERAMQDAGLFHYFNEKAIKKVLKGNKKRYKKITKATARQAATQASAEDVDAQRRAVEGYIEREPFEAPRTTRAEDSGADLAEQEELVDDLAEQDQELTDEFARLAEERQALQASERAAIEDPNETIARAETERADLETGRQRALDEQEAARAEVAELRSGGLAAAAEEATGTRLVARLDTIIAEAERRNLGPQKLDFLRNLARQERGQTLRSKSREQIASLATKIEEGMGLRQAAQDADLAARITAARRRVSAAGARARRADKAIEKRLNTIEESQAILETQYAVKGDLTPLLEQNRARMDELRARQRETAKGLRKEHARELAVRQQFEKLTAQAANETDPRLKIHANLEAQAQLGYAEAMRHGWEADANLRGLRRITQEDYRLFEMAASEQITRINRHANLWADPETAEAFLRLKEALKPESVGGILRLHDKLMSRWKAFALLSPGYHVRNTYGGMFMNAVAGYTGGPAGYLRYATFARNVRKHGADEALNRIKDPEVRAAYTTLWQNRGSVLGGAVGTDLADALGGNPGARGVLGDFARRRGANLDPTALDFAPLNVNRRIGEGAEHLLRGPLYVDSLLKGMTPQQAHARVVRFHFDYSNLSGYGLSEFERNIMRRVVPFYSWMRLNFPLQLEYMIRNPGVYTRYNHAVQNLEQGTEEEQFVPSWIGELGGFAAPATKDGDQIYVAPDMPHLRVGQTFDVDQMLSTLSPIIKTPMEMNSGERFFSNIPFKDEYTPVPTTWLPMAPFLEVAGGKLGLPRVTREGTNYYFDNEAELYKAEQALPLLGRMRRLVPNTETDQENAFRSWLGFLGFNVLANTPKQQENEMKSRAHEIEDLVDAWERRNALGADEAE